MSCFFQGKLCAANGLLFFYLVAHTIVCCQVEKTEGKKTTFFSPLSVWLEKAFPMTFQNKVLENPIFQDDHCRLDFQPLCIFPSLFGFWKKDSEHVSSFFSVVIMCIKDIPQSLYLIIIIENKARRLETSHFEKKVRKNNQRCQICRPFSPSPPLPKKKSNIIIQKSVCFLHSNPFWP